MAFNSDEYAWKDIKVVIAGRPVIGITGIKYKTTRTKTDIYGAGSKPHTRTSGNKSFTGEIMLLQSEIEALQDAAGRGKDLTDLRFDVIIAYASSPTARIVTDVLQAVDITEFEKGMEQDDSNMVVTLPIMIGDIKYSV